MHTITPTHTTIQSPLGELTIIAEGPETVGLYFPNHWYHPDPATFGPRSGEGFEDVTRQLGEYLDGERQGFELPLNAHGDAGQIRIWNLVAQVAYGQTVTYGDLARQLGDGTSAQAVGAAVGRNPLCILIPCHRVIGSNGRLTGYAGGRRAKRWLLDLEEAPSAKSARLF